MSDAAKVRLVRCPKCEKLLPELEGYSVYQCGGCGVVLRAKARDSEMDSLPQKSDEIEENLYNKPENFTFSEKISPEVSDNDVRSHSSSSGRDEKGNEKPKAEKWVVDDHNLERNEASNRFARAEMEGKFRNSRPSNGSTIGYLQSECFGDWKRGIDVGEREGILGNRNQNFQPLRFSSSIYPEDGPSNYASRPSYINTGNRADELRKVECLEQDRAELLRKLDELKDQICRSCEINDKPKEKVQFDPRITEQGVNYMNTPSQASNYNETLPYFGQHEIGMHTYYNPSGSEMLRRAHQEHNPYARGSYVGEKIDRYVQPYFNDTNLHHPHCSCVNCYHNHPRVATSVPLYNTMSYRGANKSSYGPSVYNFNHMNSHPLGTHNHHVSGYGSLHPPRVVMTSGKRCCRPLAGGAPVVSCFKCFQLLELPKKFFPTRTNHVKVKCGACSTIILFTVADKKLIRISIDTNMTPNIVVKNADLALRTSNLHTHVRANQASMVFSSEDYDDSGYDFQFLDRENHSYGSNKSENKKDFHSSSSYSSEKDVSQEVSPKLAELEVETVLSLPNQGRDSERDKTEMRKFMPRQNSMKDDALATEIDVSFNKDINGETSLKSGNASKDENLERVNKGGQSFFAGRIKKGLKDLSKLNATVEHNSNNVMINGHLITNRLLKKAEKIAGPVHPGQYWYDYRAGFWGVMGGPCLGIIPPFIEEFNYPMPENCAGGNTDVFVNGRELYQKDLSLLTSRGLPSIRDRSYIIEISGRVLDEDTGEELPSLGKLAPTVEKVKHGFGMKVPKIAA